MNSFEKMYSVKEAAAILGVSRDSVRRAILSGRLRAWKLHGTSGTDKGPQVRKTRKYVCWRVPESGLTAYMRGGQNAA